MYHLSLAKKEKNVVAIEFYLNICTEFSKPAAFCVRDKDVTTEVTERILKLTPIHVSVIYQTPWIHWISILFMENSIEWNNRGNLVCQK